MSRMIFNISAPKSGTTALFHSLIRSQGIAAPKIKEPCFFMDRDGPDLGSLPSRLNLKGRNHLGSAWFEGLYSGNTRYRIDFSTFYSAAYDAPALMAQYDPRARLILILRDPAARFLSNYYHFKKTGIQLPGLAETITQDTDFRRYMLLFSDYAGTYQRYLDMFPAAQIFTARFEDMIEVPDVFSANLAEFLDLNDVTFAPTKSERNSAGRPKSVMLQRLLLGKHMAYLSALAPLSPRPLLEARRKIVRWNTRPFINLPPSPELMGELRALLAPQYKLLSTFPSNKEVAHAA